MSTITTLSRRLSIAPMMEWTTRDFRFLARLISRRTLLYTEMVHARAVIHGDRERLLGFSSEEHPLALQLGGSEPDKLAEAARIAQDCGYDEVNLNVGCPSERVQNGAFGACLMAEPELVANCVQAMQSAVSIPVTVKTRIGIDDQDDYAFLQRLVRLVSHAGCTSFSIHARKAILSGLSPKENREIPPLNYDRAYQLKRDFPALEIIVNGGIRSLMEAKTHLEHVDGVMIGREAYHNPWHLAQADSLLFGDTAPAPSRQQVLEDYLAYVEARYRQGHHPRHALRHVLSLVQGLPGARAFRRHLSENMHQPGATPALLEQAMMKLDQQQLATASGTEECYEQA